jgi:hypothetical protein
MKLYLETSGSGSEWKKALFWAVIVGIVIEAVKPLLFL